MSCFVVLAVDGEGVLTEPLELPVECGVHVRVVEATWEELCETPAHPCLEELRGYLQ